MNAVYKYTPVGSAQELFILGSTIIKVQRPPPAGRGRPGRSESKQWGLTVL